MGNPYDEPRIIFCDRCGDPMKNDIDCYDWCRKCGKAVCLNCADEFIDGYCDDCYEPEEEAEE